jgi:DNA-binding NtrC family response regulator
MLERMKALVAEARAGHLTLDEFTQAARREYILQVLEEKRGNQVQAAASLGVHRNTLRRLLIEHDIKARVMSRKSVRAAQKVGLEKFKSA